jgi:hypothetical protein
MQQLKIYLFITLRLVAKEGIEEVPFNMEAIMPTCVDMYNITKVAQKVMSHIFFSETIYSEFIKFTYSITGCFLYTCYFST